MDTRHEAKMIYSKEQLTKELYTIKDSNFENLRNNWFNSSQDQVSRKNYISTADEWFKSTKLNVLHGWNDFEYIDATLGNTNYIESFIGKYGIHGIQVLKNEYAIYSLMGLHGVDVSELEHGKPLLITIPDFWNGTVRPEWNSLLLECEKKQIDIHIDFAWLVMSKHIEIDLSHPCIKSFAMSLSKYGMQWNRVGLRWTKQRTMDSITIYNHYYEGMNTGIYSVGNYLCNTIERDHLWNTYADKNAEICRQIGAEQTKFIHAVKLPEDPGRLYGIAKILEQ